ncbi:Lysosomal cystine transporter [Parasponia andersonii]|uniref:Lysosomal cystine transporter n=1 Tax=Parasponia andersonii TaxID=3476 RepID=A0A2P5B5G6_PARAD|nr:Lysosomal cystine transporter [Parasponia andersonii]
MGTSGTRKRKKEKEIRNGIMEFDSAGNNTRSSWLDCVFVVVPQFLSASHLELPSKKVIPVVGLNFDFVVLNLTKHSSYIIYNVTLYFSSTVQKQNFEKYGFGEMIPVTANDVAFSIHVTLLTIFLLFQISIYEVFMNFKRKSTDGFSIGYILCDFPGGVANYAQMAVKSIDQNSWVNFHGNIGKRLLSLAINVAH